MKFLLDENIGKQVAKFLKHLGHSTLRIREINPGIPDYEVLILATSKQSIIITSDKDYGELIFKEMQPHTGVIFLRLQDQSSENKIRALKVVFSKYKDIENKFIRVKETDGKFRIKIVKELT